MENSQHEPGKARAWVVGARSETGYARHDNQDRMSRVSAKFGDVFIVSDGMGGHKGGAFAAEMTVKMLESKMVEAGANDEIVDVVKKAFEAANAAVYEKAHGGDSETEGMGATALMLVTTESSALVAHVGDSRAYLFRQGRLQRLTIDHTRVQRMVDAGMLSAREAEEHPDAGLLERAMGNKPDIEVDIAPWLALNNGDQLLLCSDGLCGYVEDSEIEAAMSKPSAPQDLVDDLVALSLAKGGNDNVTVQIIRYGDQMDYISPGRMLLYQVAFLPVAALVSGATAYAVYEFGLGPSLAALRQDVSKLEKGGAMATADISALRAKLDARPPPSPVVKAESPPVSGNSQGAQRGGSVPQSGAQISHAPVARSERNPPARRVASPDTKPPAKTNKPPESEAAAPPTRSFKTPAARAPQAAFSSNPPAPRKPEDIQSQNPTPPAKETSQPGGQSTSGVPTSATESSSGPSRPSAPAASNPELK